MGVLDLRFNGKLEKKYALRINCIANELHNDFYIYIENISKPYEFNLDWWVEGSASRNNIASPLFHYCCSLMLVQELHKECNVSEIIVDSTIFYKIILDVIETKGINT